MCSPRWIGLLLVVSDSVGGMGSWEIDWLSLSSEKWRGKDQSHQEPNLEKEEKKKRRNVQKIKVCSHVPSVWLRYPCHYWRANVVITGGVTLMFASLLAMMHTIVAPKCTVPPVGLFTVNEINWTATSLRHYRKSSNTLWLGYYHSGKNSVIKEGVH